MDMHGAKIMVRGTVQGVGFRPYVYGLARMLEIRGLVTNASWGVYIEAEGARLDEFIERLPKDAPAISKIESVEIEFAPVRGHVDFVIQASTEGGSFTLIPPDTTVCSECLIEMRDPNDRRYSYPFINCTNCGPRYSIAQSVPYDRNNTTMSEFPMCPVCMAEYQDPKNRRFHAEPNACPVCGPVLDGPIKAVLDVIASGGVAAIKGLGGFHLACDAKNPSALYKLRDRKRKNNKPFALMAGTLEAIKEHCIVTDAEEAQLMSGRRPIVLLEKKSNCTLPGDIAPLNKRLGFMLPYTPLHSIIFDILDKRAVLVMTSGNIAEEPIQAFNDEARTALTPLADIFLSHNRRIHMRVDDSVVSVSKRLGTTLSVRRARGYAPEPILMESVGPEVLAVGADMKNTFALGKGRYIIPSQHIGDMENYETVKFFEQTLENLKSLYRVSPAAIACDMHPAYHSTAWAENISKQTGLPLMHIQHHHAHIASVIAEKGLEGKVIGIAFDGTGYGEDGTLWGGEFLVADSTAYKRAAHIKHMTLPGAETAVREPWRTAVGLIGSVYGGDARSCLSKIGFYEKYGEAQVQQVLEVSGRPGLSPISSGAGRLFDAVSAMLGICGVSTFEAEAACALEACSRPGVSDMYQVDIKRAGGMLIVDFSFAVIGIINDMACGRDKGEISSKFHNSVADSTLRTVSAISHATGIVDAVLSGGVFQNEALRESLLVLLRREGFSVHVNSVVPANDGGISLGQAHVLRSRMSKGTVKWS